MATRQHLLDLLLAEHPPGAIIGAGGAPLGETAMGVFLDNAVAVFCEESRLYRDVLTITTEADTTAYEIESSTGSLLRVAVPALGSRGVLPRLLTPIQSVRGPSNAASSLPVYYVEPDSDGAFHLHVGRIGDGALTALDAGLTIEIKRAGRPARLSAAEPILDHTGEPIRDHTGEPVLTVPEELDDVLALPEPFQMAPVHYAQRELYMMRRDLPMPERLAISREHKRMYRDLLRPARAYGERQLTPGIYPRPVYY